MRVCFVGDSLVNGTGDPEFQGWTSRVCITAQKMGHDVTHYNLGVRGETSANIRDRWLSEVSVRLAATEEAVVVFSFGVNDLTIEGGEPRVSNQNSIENLRRILGESKRRYTTLMVGPPPTADAEKNISLARLSRDFSAACREIGVPYLDVFMRLQESGVWILEAAGNDGTHPRATGYAEMAKLVQSWPAWVNWLTPEEVSHV